MGENAELWCRPDDTSCRIALQSWLKFHDVEFDTTLSTEKLRQLYIETECGTLIN